MHFFLFVLCGAVWCAFRFDPFLGLGAGGTNGTAKFDIELLIDFCAVEVTALVPFSAALVSE